MKYVLLTVGAALVGAILKDSVAAISKRLVGAVERWVERRFSSSRRLYARSIRRYRKDVANQYRHVPVPFDLPVELPMEDVYIPLRAAGRAAEATAGGSADLASAVADARSTVVLGPPGSGKSLFLRYLLWSECREVTPPEPVRPTGRRLGLRRRRAQRPRNDNRRRLPVLIPLNRLAETGDLPAAIAAAFARHGFPGAAAYMERELNRPHPDLVVLFDGLDEVGSDKRASVVQLVVDFADDHPDVRFVVTCRTEVYGKALDGKVERILHVADLTDELVERFLHAWPPMSSPATADRLVVALRDNPRVGELVRNPLLLTMLAYLYTDEYDQSTARLPDNRTQFYSEGSRLLLQRWKGEHNRFRWEVKKLVLQDLALCLQASHRERRSATYEGALKQIQQVLSTRLSRTAGEAEAVLAEIVERSGLLVTLDDGERYQFAHLSMQEYFAAVELRDRPDELLVKYKADPDAWREPLKLWCGGDQDSTRVIQAVADDGDDVLALSCLADAIQVNESAATALIDRMKKRLDADDPDEAVVRAFGQLAADPRPSGRAVLGYLREASTDGAVAALAMSNLPEAAKVLAEGDLDRTAPYLQRMGNVAVPALAEAALGDGHFLQRLVATTTLAAIGTPTAALQLVPALWTDDVRVATYAAIGLLQLTEQPAVEDALATLDLDRISGEPPSPTWAPFLQDRSPSERAVLGLILDRCRALLHDLCHRTFPSHEEGPLEIDDWSRDREAGDYYGAIAALAFQRWMSLHPFGSGPSPEVMRVDAVLQEVVSRAYGQVGDDPLTRHVRLQDSSLLLHAELASEHRALIDQAAATGSLPFLAFGLPLPPITRPLDARVLLALAFFSPELDEDVVVDDVDEAMATTLWDRVRLKPEPFPELLDHVRPETREVLEAAVPEARPSPREWGSFGDEARYFHVEESIYFRFPQVVVLAVVAAAAFFGGQAFLESSGWDRVGLGAVLVALTTPLWYLLDWNAIHLYNEPDHDIEDFFLVTVLSPLAASDEYDGWALRTLVAVPLVGFTPAWVYGLLRWVHPPGLIGTGVAVVGFLVLTLVPITWGRWLHNLRRHNENAALMLRRVFGAGGDRLSG